MLSPRLSSEDNYANCKEPEAGPLPVSVRKKGLAPTAGNTEFAVTLDQLLISFRARILEEHARFVENEHGDCTMASNRLAPNASPIAGASRPKSPPLVSTVAAGGPPAPEFRAKQAEDVEPQRSTTVLSLGSQVSPPIDDKHSQPDISRIASIFKMIDKDGSGFIEVNELKRCLKAKPGLVVDEVLEAAHTADKNGDHKLDLPETTKLVQLLAQKGIELVAPEGDALVPAGYVRHAKTARLRRKETSKASRVSLSHDPGLHAKMRSEKVKVSRLFLLQRLELELDLVNVFKQLFMYAVYVLPFWFFILLIRQPVDIADAHRMLTAHYGIQPTQLAAITEWSQVYSFMHAFSESNDLLQATGKVYWCDPRFLLELGLNDEGKAEYQRQEELKAQLAGLSHRRLGSSPSSSSSAGETLEQKLLRLRLAYQNPTPLGMDAEGHDMILYDCRLPTNYEMLTWYHDLQDVMRENTTAPVTDYGSRRRDSHRRLASLMSSPNGTNYTYLASAVGPKAEYQHYFSQFREDFINYNVERHEPEQQHHPPTDKYLPRYRYPYRQISLLDPLVYQKRMKPLSCTGDTFADKYAHQVWNPDAPYGINAPKATDIFDCFDKEVLEDQYVAADIDTDGYEYKDQVVYARFAYQSGDHTGGTFDDWQRISWLDKLTKDVTISALIYTQEIELFTMVTVQFEQGAGGGVHATIKLDSVVDFAHGNINTVLAVGIASAVFASIAFGQSALQVRSIRRQMLHCSIKQFIFYHGMPVLLFEMFSRLAVILFLLLYLILWSSLPSIAVEFDEVLHTFLDLHDYSHSGMHSAIQHVFEVKEWIDTNASFEKQMGFLCAIVFLIQAFQLIVYVSVHPRLGVLMSTMVRTIDDIFHFMILFCALFGLLGFFAHFTFAAASPDEFGTMARALGKQFELVIGYGDDWPWRAFDNMDPLAAIMFQMYVFSFVLLVFFVMINFFVGIVLQGFFDTKKAVEDLVIEKSFWADMTDVPVTFYRYAKAKWPKRADTISTLKANHEHDTLSPGDLVRLSCFPDATGALAFLEYYGVKVPTMLEEEGF